MNKKLKLMSKSSLFTSKLLGVLSNYIKSGVTGLFLNKISEEFINDNKIKSAFLNYNNYPFNICVSINNEIIHGIPNNRCFKEGDIVTIDCGVIYKKYYSDCAYTFFIGNINKQNMKLIKITKRCLYKAIKQCKNNNYINNIGNIINKYIVNNNFNVVINYCGHGIGKKLHKYPLIYNYGKKNTGKKLKKGMFISIEPIVTIGNSDNYISKNKWTVKTKNGNNSAHFEHNIAILKNNYKILTSYKFIKKKYYIN